MGVGLSMRVGVEFSKDMGMGVRLEVWWGVGWGGM